MKHVDFDTIEGFRCELRAQTHSRRRVRKKNLKRIGIEAWDSIYGEWSFNGILDGLRAMRARPHHRHKPGRDVPGNY